MKKKSTENIVKYKANELPEDTKSDWLRVDAMTEKELTKNAESDPETLWADEKFWQVAKLVIPAIGNKEKITIKIDADVLNWIKLQGHGYQSRINAILRGFMVAEKEHHYHK